MVTQTKLVDGMLLVKPMNPPSRLGVYRSAREGESIGETLRRTVFHDWCRVHNPFTRSQLSLSYSQNNLYVSVSTSVLTYQNLHLNISQIQDIPSNPQCFSSVITLKLLIKPVTTHRLTNIDAHRFFDNH